MSKSQINSEETSALLTRLGNKGLCVKHSMRIAGWGIANVFSKDGKNLLSGFLMGGITAKEA